VDGKSDVRSSSEAGMAGPTVVRWEDEMEPGFGETNETNETNE
jgi:hypothetical protein